jgi:hypothetical protein
MNTNTNIKVFANKRKTRFKLARCDLYHPVIHGKTTDFIASQFLVDFIIHKRIVLNSPQFLIDCNVFHNKKIIYCLNNQQLFNTHHPIIRNYVEISIHKTHNNNDIVEIIEIIDDDTGFEIRCAIKKTFFLRIFQRKCRNYLNRRNQAIQNRMKISSLNYSRVYGRWPVECYY